jgi:CubicO group peptidase (beta-lactamase class C family)
MGRVLRGRLHHGKHRHTNADLARLMGVVNPRFLLTRRAAGAGLIGVMVAPAAACGQAGAPIAAPSTTPAREPVRLDAAALALAFSRFEALPQGRSMIIAQHGAVVREQAVRGNGLNTPVNIKSAAKSVLAAIAGAALDRGVLESLDQPVAPLLKPYLPPAPDPRLATVTVEHLLSMATGLERTSGRNYGRWVSSRSWTGFALARPFVDEPGGRMLYSTGTSHILSAVLTAASGKSTLDLARAYLAEPLGITIPPWPRDPQGIYFGGNDMLMSPRALLRLGEMYRNGGLHEGRQVLSRAYVEDSFRSRGGRSPYNGYTYGLGWWIREAAGHPVYFAWGYGGQMVYVVPSLALTVVMTSDPAVRSSDGHVQALHALMDQAVIAAASPRQAA